MPPTDDCDDAVCPVCFGPMDREPCWQCDGEGGWHDCGEDCCCCADPDEIDIWCDECDGEGEYLVCAYLPHTEAQMREYRRRRAEPFAAWRDVGGEAGSA